MAGRRRDASAPGAHARRARGVGDRAEDGQRLPAQLRRAVPKCLRAAQTRLRLKMPSGTQPTYLCKGGVPGISGSNPSERGK
jgi:hypothetical protein